MAVIDIHEKHNQAAIAILIALLIALGSSLTYFK
jgi:hypothetical protein